jgi:ABC-2 type transport system permease protein
MYLNALATITYRDFMKYLRNRPRIIFSLVFPAIFIGVLGGSFQSNFGSQIGFNFITFVFVGIVTQTMFSTVAQGLMSMATDRDSNFTQELLAAPIPRFTILLGKIFGEALAALTQLVGVVIIALLMGAQVSAGQVLTILPAAILVGLMGGGFGVLVMANIKDQQAANQVFPLLMFPQFFLAGLFTPVRHLPWVLNVLSRITPLRYAVDLLRGIYYQGRPEYSKVVFSTPWIDAVVVATMFVVFLGIGTFQFVKNEKDR